MKILVDPGHGGRDSGAISPIGIREADITLILGRLLRRVVTGLGHSAYLTRWVDVFVSLEDRTRLSNALQPDCFISLHCNSSESGLANGFEIWTSPGITQADYLAMEIYRSIERSFPCRRFRPDWADGFPDKEAGFHVLTRTQAPAVLVELEFINNAHGEEFLTNPWTQQRAVLAITEGLLQWRRTNDMPRGTEK